MSYWIYYDPTNAVFILDSIFKAKKIQGNLIQYSSFTICKLFYMNGVNGPAPALKAVFGGGGFNTYLDGRTLSPYCN